jgi:hypothetical protein
MTSFLSELLTAHKRARTRDLAPALQACGLPIDSGPTWGVAFVEPSGPHYTPREGGKPAIIVPVFDGGELIDLTATGLETRRTVTRLGIASVLGQVAIDCAKDSETYVYLFSDPIEWLRNRCAGAVVLDWSVARYELADLPGIACATEFVAARIDKELRQPTHVPPLFVREGMHREAA